MDWNAAIEKNTQALKRVLSTLVAMAGLGGGSPTLPRHLHRAILRLLRPAESAARRLVIVAARGLVAPIARQPVIQPAPPKPPARALPADTSRIARRLGFQLFDPLPRWDRRRRPVATSVPRISFPGVCRPSPLPIRLPPAPDDPILAARLGQRLSALVAALDDLPRQARRFARWRARRAVILPCEAGEVASPGLAFGKPRKKLPDGGGTVNIRKAPSTSRFRRVWPLRPGRPPGQRAARNRDAVHDILDVTHGLAFWALEPPDTS